MQTFFFICFGVGAGFTIISFLFGELLGHIDAGDIDIDTGFDTHIDGGLDTNIDGGFDTHIDAHANCGSGVSPLKPSVIASFLTVFGGTGLLMIRRYDWIFSLISAGLLGMLVAYLIFRFIIVPLNKSQNTSAVEKQSLIGHNAVVSEFIPQGGYGKITYYAMGNTYSSPAKSESGEPINKKDNVEIVYIEKNTYFVRKK